MKETLFLVQVSLRRVWRLGARQLLRAFCLLGVSVFIDVEANESFSNGHRIVTIAPHLAEITHAAGAGGYLVGVVSGTNYPVTTRDIPLIGDSSGLDFERIIMLRPTMVLAWAEGNKTSDIQKLRQLNIPVTVFPTATIVDIPKHIIQVGSLFDSIEYAQKMAQTLTSKIEKLKNINHSETKRVFVKIWDTPLFTIGHNHFVNEVLRICGAKNVSESYEFISAPLAQEELILLAPQIVLDLTGLENNESRRPFLYAGSSRVKEDPEILMRATPRLINALGKICSRLR